MNKAFNVLRVLKWMCLPLGWIMYLVTRDVVGEVGAVALAVIATVAFWVIVRKEETRQMEQSIAQVIQEAIREYNGAGNAVEIVRIRSGVVARVYVMGDESTMQNLLKGMQNAVSQALKQADLYRRVWILQLTTAGSEQDIPEKRELLNQQMRKDLETIQRQRQTKDKQEDRNGKE